VTVSEALSEKMLEFMAARGWTQRQLGAQLACSQAAVNAILKKRRRRQALDFYTRLATVFGVSLAEMFQELEERASGVPIRRVLIHSQSAGASPAGESDAASARRPLTFGFSSTTTSAVAYCASRLVPPQREVYLSTLQQLYHLQHVQQLDRDLRAELHRLRCQIDELRNEQRVSRAIALAPAAVPAPGERTADADVARPRKRRSLSVERRTVSAVPGSGSAR